MAATLNGACLCGGVADEVRDPEAVTDGDDLVGTYESEFAPRNFCGNCGSALFDDLGGRYFVAAGLMRDLDMIPAFHLQVAYKAPWEEIGDSAERFAENPPG